MEWLVIGIGIDDVHLSSSSFLAWSSIAQSVCQRAFSLLAIWCLGPRVQILPSAEEHNLSPFDLNIACLCQSIEINNNKYIDKFHRSLSRTPTSQISQILNHCPTEFMWWIIKACFHWLPFFNSEKVHVDEIFRRFKTGTRFLHCQ